VLFFALLAMFHQSHGLDSCSTALQPIFSGAQGYRCVQLTITTASGSTSAVRPLLLASSSALSEF
jgi:hypothetical protein